MERNTGQRAIREKCTQEQSKRSGQARLVYVKDTNGYDRLVSDPFHPPNLFKVWARLCLFGKGVRYSEESSSLCCCVSDFSSWARSVWLGPFFACAILMQCSCRVDLSWSLINSLQLEGCASNNVRWSPMPLFASSLVSHKRSSPLAAHFQESGHFLVVFSFHVPDLLSLFLHIAFLLEVVCCLSWTEAATCETNSLECGWKFPITKARLLTLTQTWKQTKGESSRLRPARLYCGEIWTCKPGLWTEHVRRHFNTSLACRHVVIYTPAHTQTHTHAHTHTQDSGEDKLEWTVE